MNDNWSKRFRYPLDPFLRKKKLDLTCVKLEEARARSILDERKHTAAAIESEIDTIAQSLRQSAERGAPIDRDQQQNISNYLKHTRHGLEQARKQVEHANQTHQQVSREMSTIHQGIKALEKHKTQKHAAHSQEVRRREYNDVDELYLSNTGNRAAAPGNLLPAKQTRGVSRRASKGDKNGN